MEYPTHIKKTLFLFSLFLFLNIFIVLSGVQILNYYWEYQKEVELLSERIMAEKKQYIRDAVKNVVRDIENDWYFCREWGAIDSFVGSQISKARRDCESTYLIEMTKSRIKEITLKTGGHLRVKKIVNYEGGKNYAIGVVHSAAGKKDGVQYDTEMMDSKGDRPYLQELEGIKEFGEIFFESWFKIDSHDLPENTLTYAKLTKELDWVIAADVNLGEVDGDVAKQADEAWCAFYHRATTATLIVFVLLLLPLFVIYLFCQKFDKTISQQVAKIKLKEENLLAENFSLKDLATNQTAAIKKCEDTLSEIFQAADNVICVVTEITDKTPVISKVSSGVEKMLGYPTREMLGQSPSCLYPPEIDNDLTRMVEGRKHVVRGFAGEIKMVKKNGETLPVLYSTQPRFNMAGVCCGIITIAIDISQLHETRKTLSITEERLQQAQKMEAIGTLAGGIAHDFNNVLSSIVGYSELVKEQLQPDSQASQDLDQVLRASTRAANLVKQILAFSRKTNMENSYFEPAIIVKETLKMLRSTIPSTIEIQDRIEAEGHSVYANSTQFHQVFMNLCTNGYQAMEPDGGTMTVSLRRITDIGHVPQKFLLEEDEYLELIVADTGGGVAPEIKDKIFEPFFSTKESTKGTGMGLSTVHKIVTKNGGAIWFNDRSKQGTEFHVVLPVCEEEISKNNIEVTVGPIPRGSECILFVDDEPEITSMAKAILGSIGYTVHCRNNSTEALELFLKNQQLFDLIITDQTMPEMTGAELARNVRQCSSTIPIILSTGYSARISEENWVRHGINGFIMKPFRKMEIARLIRETLDSLN